MRKEDIHYMPAYEMKEKIKTQELTSQEITEVLIERIEKINPIINAYCTPTFELAREMAKNADKAIKEGRKLGNLHGIPLSIKDEMPIKGIRTTFGSKLFENHIAGKDDIAVKRLKDAGCVILGKTNMPEFGLLGITHNLIFGATCNPWDLKKTPGGSSGGAAAAVASGLGPLALGADGGGSIRIPSSLCGVYGIKPSFGRVPIYPTSGIHYDSLTHYGPITRYVEDAALMLDIIKGRHDVDMYTLPNDEINYHQQINETPKELKIGYSLNLGFAKVIDSEVEEKVINAVNKFARLDWEIEQAKLKIKNPERYFFAILAITYGYDLMKAVKNSRDQMDPDVVKAVEAGLNLSGIDFARAIDHRKRLYEHFYKYFQDYDILITPTTAYPAFELGIPFPNKIGDKMVSPTAWMPFTTTFNLTGHPAASIPCGWTKNGLPIGMQIIGDRFDELTILQVSRAFEEIQPWQDIRPKFE